MEKITLKEIESITRLPQIKLSGNGGGCAEHAVQTAAYFNPNLDTDKIEEIMDVYEKRLSDLSPWKQIYSRNFFNEVKEALFLRIYRDSPIMDRFIHTGILCDESKFVGVNGSERFAENITEITEEHFAESGEFNYNWEKDDRAPFYLFYCPISLVETSQHDSRYNNDNEPGCNCELI